MLILERNAAGGTYGFPWRFEYEVTAGVSGWNSALLKSINSQCQTAKANELVWYSPSEAIIRCRNGEIGTLSVIWATL